MTEEQVLATAVRARRLDNAFDVGMILGVALMVYGAYLIAAPFALILGGLFLALGCFALARANSRSRHE